jgi:hypothetical protein
MTIGTAERSVRAGWLLGRLAGVFGLVRVSWPGFSCYRSP